MPDTPIKFIHPVSAEVIRLSTRWLMPRDATHVMLLAHGAGANLDHHHMQHIADSLAEKRIATLRFNFPYMQAGKKRTDTLPVCLAAINLGLQALLHKETSCPILLAGHSFGGRMMSHYAATQLADEELMPASQRIAGLVYFSFPLHPTGKPDTKRAGHMSEIALPQVFLSGTRDTLAQGDLLTQTVHGMQNAKIHWLDTADHGFKILKRTRTNPESVYHESARIVHDWLPTCH